MTESFQKHLTEIELGVNMPNCSRCDGSHDDVMFQPFTKPSDAYTHWAMCPTTNEPIVMSLGRPSEASELEEPCPLCSAGGFNRIWDCGSLMVSGEVVQGKECKRRSEDV